MLQAGETEEGEEPAALPGDDTSIPSSPKHPSILTGALATRASKPVPRKPQPTPRCPTKSTAETGDSRCSPPRPQRTPVAAHLYPHDGKVWHGRVVEVDAGVELALRSREDLGAARCWRVVEHLAQGEDVNEFGGEPGAHCVIRACHALHAVCGDEAAPSAHPSPPAHPGAGEDPTSCRRPWPPWGDSPCGVSGWESPPPCSPPCR